MASYVVLARKWRPSQFSDIVGQSHIVRTLMNAIRADRIHQAYLLTGSRGIGKTSIARIFAKAVRCENVQWVDNWLRSCDQCSSCKEIVSSNSVDVIEIDGASNNGVDAIREIRENAKYLPSSGNRKIYIIDEVHMLTTAAFNALLKTLEEPPPHVIFIFATTEPHKIPATILSRCQRFDLRRVTMAQIQTRLAEVTKAENIQAEPGALALIARAAEGSMRDALSILDQVIAFSGTSITTLSTRESIGLIEGQTILGILKGILERQPLHALELVEQAYQQGHDLRVLTRSLIEFLYGTILAKLGASNCEMLELSADEWSELKSLAALRPLEEMELIFQALHHGVDWIARSPQPKIVLDVLLIKCATAEILVQVEQASASTTAPGPMSAPVRTATARVAAADTVKTAQPAPDKPPVAPSETSSSSWEGFIDHVRQTRPLLASILENGSCQSLPSEGNGAVVLCYHTDEAYFREQLQSHVYSDQLVTLGKEYFKQPVHFKIELKNTGESLAARKEREAKEREAATRTAAQNHPIISEAKSLFGGELGPIELTEDTEEDSE